VETGTNSGSKFLQASGLIGGLTRRHILLPLYGSKCWTIALKVRVEEATPTVAYANSSVSKTGYNAVLGNLYRGDGNDSVGLQADAEPEMGPVIASVSLGAERLFRLWGNDGTVGFSEWLPHGCLLIMAGATQKNFRHEIPKEPEVTESRLNLTFRRIEHK
jgi:alkylated DNA repair dioxygenase AlkB